MNDYLKGKNEIQLINTVDFEIKGKNTVLEPFKAKIFKIYYPANQKSKVSLTGHNREVSEANLHRFIPEFEDDFFDKESGGLGPRNYIIKTYVLGNYLDKNVSLERETFNFPKDNSDMYYPISQFEIEYEASLVTKSIFQEDVTVRSEKKEKRIKDYVNNTAPWHRPYVKELNISTIGYNIDDEGLELELQKAKFNKEQTTRAQLKRLLDASDDEFQSNMSEAISKISEIGKSDLAHYVFNRKIVIDTLTELLKRREDGKGELEKDLHNIIFPMGKDSEVIAYQDHNLWLLDERLVFSEYIASDRKISVKGKGRSSAEKALAEPDLVVFDQKRSFRSGENEFSNPLTIFEFKRPKRVNYTEDEDPILQIGRYVKDIRDGKFDMPEGLEKIKVNEYTPVYGYVVCDLSDRIKEFAVKHQLILSPDQEGYFGYHSGYRVYFEIVSFRKLLHDASLRNRIFFKKLQLE